MLIRDQQKGAIINLDKVVHTDISGAYDEFDIHAIVNENMILYLGTYKTKEKAIKVLSMIEEAYAKWEVNKILFSGACEVVSYRDNVDYVLDMMCGLALFQMPQDEEVKV